MKNWKVWVALILWLTVGVGANILNHIEADPPQQVPEAVQEEVAE